MSNAGIVARITNDAGSVLFDMSGDQSFCMMQGATATIDDWSKDAPILTLDIVSTDDVETRLTQIALLGRTLAAARRHASDPLSGDWYWLEFYEPHESPRRALLYGGAYEIGAGQSQIAQIGTGHAVVTVAFEHGAWESVEPLVITLSGNAAPYAGAVALQAAGDLPGRIGRLVISSDATGGKVVGIRPFNRGVLQFNPALNGGAGAHGFTDNSEEVAWTEPLKDLVTSTDYRHYAGRYRVYGGITSDATTLGVRVSAGGGGASQVYQPSWVSTALYHFGDIILPPFGRGHTSAEMGNVTLTAYVQAYSPTITAGSPAKVIGVDAVTLIPADMWLTMSGAGPHVLETDPVGNVSIWDDAGTALTAANGEHGGGWQYPHDGGLLAWAQLSLAVVTTFSATLTVYPRWSAYRSRHA